MTGLIIGCCLSFLFAFSSDTMFMIGYLTQPKSAFVVTDSTATAAISNDIVADSIIPIPLETLNKIKIGDTLCDGIVLDKSNDGHGLIYYPVGFNTCNYVNARISVAMQRNDYGKGLTGRLRLPSAEELQLVSERLLTNPKLTWLGFAARWTCEVQSVGNNGKVAVYDLTKNEKNIVPITDENFLSYVFEY